MCRWCSTVKSSNDCVVHLKDYAPPVTPTKLIKNIVVIATDVAGAPAGVLGTQATKTAQGSVKVASGGCGKAADMKLSTNGQKLEFSINSAIPLAAGQHVVWEDKGAALAFNIASAPAADSVECKCGTKTWSQTMTKPSNHRLQLALPAAQKDTNSE